MRRLPPLPAPNAAKPRDHAPWRRKELGVKTQSRFIHEQNIKRYAILLAVEVDAQRRTLIERLLAEERAALLGIQDRPDAQQ